MRCLAFSDVRYAVIHIFLIPSCEMTSIATGRGYSSSSTVESETSPFCSPPQSSSLTSWVRSIWDSSLTFHLQSRCCKRRWSTLFLNSTWNLRTYFFLSSIHDRTFDWAIDTTCDGDISGGHSVWSSTVWEDHACTLHVLWVFICELGGIPDKGACLFWSERVFPCLSKKIENTPYLYIMEMNRMGYFN